MTKFWLLFAIFFLSLTVMPCSDENDCKEINPTELSNLENHQNHKEDIEHCPPFCSCACCGIFASQIINELFTIEQANISIYKKQKISFFKSSFLSNFSCKIWQPPQLNV